MDQLVLLRVLDHSAALQAQIAHDAQHVHVNLRHLWQTIKGGWRLNRLLRLLVATQNVLDMPYGVAREAAIVVRGEQKLVGLVAGQGFREHSGEGICQRLTQLPDGVQDRSEASGAPNPGRTMDDRQRLDCVEYVLLVDLQPLSRQMGVSHAHPVVVVVELRLALPEVQNVKAGIQERVDVLRRVVIRPVGIPVVIAADLLQMVASALRHLDAVEHHKFPHRITVSSHNSNILDEEEAALGGQGAKKIAVQRHPNRFDSNVPSTEFLVHRVSQCHHSVRHGSGRQVAIEIVPGQRTQLEHLALGGHSKHFVQLDGEVDCALLSVGLREVGQHDDLLEVLLEYLRPIDVGTVTASAVHAASDVALGVLVHHQPELVDGIGQRTLGGHIALGHVVGSLKKIH